METIGFDKIFEILPQFSAHQFLITIFAFYIGLIAGEVQVASVFFQVSFKSHEKIIWLLNTTKTIKYYFTSSRQVHLGVATRQKVSTDAKLI